MPTIPSFTLPALTPWGKKQLLRYATRLLVAQQHMLAHNGNSILHYTLGQKKQHVSMSHYPKGDRIDYQTGAQYFYHCHRENFEREEHGHFHTFLRYKHIPKHIKPAKLPDWDKHIDNPMTHLVAIAMNRLGEPIRLFSVNRWISSEIWYDAKHAKTFTNRFKMTLTDDPYWQILDQWVEAVIHLFAPQITWVYNARDAAIKAHQQQNPGLNVYEHQGIEELSEININVQEHIQWILDTPK
jgi:hypothetical protein